VLIHANGQRLYLRTLKNLNGHGKAGGTYRVGQLVGIAPLPFTDATVAAMALLLLAGATCWIIRRHRRAPSRPDVGAVSTTGSLSTDSRRTTARSRHQPPG
jgi:hypothetical protein